MSKFCISVAICSYGKWIRETGRIARESDISANVAEKRKKGENEKESPFFESVFRQLFLAVAYYFGSLTCLNLHSFLHKGNARLNEKSECFKRFLSVLMHNLNLICIECYIDPCRSLVFFNV